MKKHWFAFTYTGKNRDGSPGQAWSSAYTGYAQRESSVTMAMIQENKAFADVADDATLISVSYLGFMTRDEFTAGQAEGGDHD